MKKEDIKSDPIKDKIVEIVDYIVSNSRTVWILLFSFAIVHLQFAFRVFALRTAICNLH